MSMNFKQETDKYKSTVHFLSNSNESGGVYGLQGSASAFLIAAAIRSGAKGLISIHADSSEALNMAGDVKFYLGANESDFSLLDDQIIHYPASDLSPFSCESSELDVWTARTATIFRITEMAAPKVIFLSVDSLMRKVPPRQVFAKAGFTISVNDELHREELFEKLVQLGYSRSPLVEDVGDFSVRGFIIDIYPPLYPKPVRIEQIGDMVESIRFFDPSDQRSKGDMAQALIGPVHMFIPDDQEIEAGLGKILSVCEERGVEKKVRQRILDDIKNRIRFQGSDLYLPYFFPDMVSLLDLAPVDSTVLLPDQDTLSKSMEDHEDEIFKGWEFATARGLPVPEPQELYFLKNDIHRTLNRFRTVEIARLEIQRPEVTSYRLSGESNSDIRKELANKKTVDSGVSSFVSKIHEWRDTGSEVFLVCHTMGQANRLMKLLSPYDVELDFLGEGFETSSLDPVSTPGLRLCVGQLSCGFRLRGAGKIIITEEEIFGAKVRAPSKKRSLGALISSLADLGENEAVVHEDYGIGVYRGLIKKEFDGVTSEVMVIEFAGGDLLYHPVERLQVIQKFASGNDGPPRIDRLGGKGWAKTKAKVKESLKEIAHELLRIYAKREISTRSPYTAPDEQFSAFEASLPVAGRSGPATPAPSPPAAT